MSGVGGGGLQALRGFGMFVGTSVPWISSFVIASSGSGDTLLSSRFDRLLLGASGVSDEALSLLCWVLDGSEPLLDAMAADCLMPGLRRRGDVEEQNSSFGRLKLVDSLWRCFIDVDIYFLKYECEVMEG